MLAMPGNEQSNAAGASPVARVLWDNTASGKLQSEPVFYSNGQLHYPYQQGYAGDQRGGAEQNGQGLTSHQALPALPGPPFGFSPTKRDSNVLQMGPPLAVWPAASPQPSGLASFGAGQPSNPRKRAWVDEEDDDGINDFTHSSDDVMMTDDASPSVPTRSSYPLVPQNYHGLGSRPPYFDQAPDSPLRSNGDRQFDGDGGMVGRMKRVRMNDASDSEDLSSAYVSLPVPQISAQPYRDVPEFSQQSPDSSQLDPGYFSPPPRPAFIAPTDMPHLGTSGFEPVSPALPGRFRINLRTPGATPKRMLEEGPKTPPASPYAGFNSLLGQLHIRHHGVRPEEGKNGGGEHQGHGPMPQPEDPNSIALQYSRINNLLKQYEDSRRERKGDLHDWPEE